MTPPAIKHVHFDRLPTASRSALTRLVREGATLASQARFGTAAWPVVALLLGLTVIAVPLVGTWGRELQPLGALPVFVLGAVLATWGALAWRRQRVGRAALPFEPGRYLLPLDAIDARDPVLGVYPLAAATDFQGVHQHLNGRYTHTSLRFSFPDQRFSFVVVGKHKADRLLERLRDAQIRRVAAAHGADPADGGEVTDPFAAARADAARWEALEATPPPARPSEPRAGAAAGPLARRAGLVALVLGAALGAGVVFGQNALTDGAVLARAVEADSVHRLERYLARGGQQVEAVRATHLPAARFSEAQHEGTVAALREFRRQFPGSAHDADARAAIAARYREGLDAFRARAADDPELVAHMERVFAFLEAHDAPAVSILFAPPDAASLAETDALIEELGEEAADVPIAKIAPSFAGDRLERHERRIARSLEVGFEAVVPSDVLDLEHGGRIAGDAAPARPTLQVAYTVRPSGALYTNDDESLGFVGIEVRFDIALTLPDDRAHRFTVTVEPPETFYVSSSARIGTHNPSTHLVYDTMAERAFDRLGAALGVAFFGAEAPAGGGVATRAPGAAL